MAYVTPAFRGSHGGERSVWLTSPMPSQGPHGEERSIWLTSPVPSRGPHGGERSIWLTLPIYSRGPHGGERSIWLTSPLPSRGSHGREKSIWLRSPLSSRGPHGGERSIWLTSPLASRGSHGGRIMRFFRLPQPLKLGSTPYIVLRCIHPSCCARHSCGFRLAMLALTRPTEAPSLLRMYNTAEWWVVSSLYCAPTCDNCPTPLQTGCTACCMPASESTCVCDLTSVPSFSGGGWRRLPP